MLDCFRCFNFFADRGFTSFVLTTFEYNSFHSNLTDRHIKSMEFNVLDSLNTKLIRPVSTS